MRDLLFIFLSMIIGAVCYLASYNLYIALAIFLLYVLYYFVIGRRFITKRDHLILRIHASYHFINAFIISMSVKESIEDAYQSGIRYDHKEIKELIGPLDEMKVSDRLVYLREYFNLAIFKMFLNVFNFYQDQGGNILSMSDELIRESTRMEKNLTESIAMSNKHLGEFLVLWVMSIGVLVFIRFSISSFYTTMLKSSAFFIMLILYFILVLVSIHLFIVRYSTIVVKEDQYDE